MTTFRTVFKVLWKVPGDSGQTRYFFDKTAAENFLQTTRTEMSNKGIDLLNPNAELPTLHFVDVAD